jgi:hypothetical protein
MQPAAPVAALSFQQQLGDVRRNPPRLITRQWLKNVSLR